MAAHNPFRAVMDDIVAEHLRRGEKRKSAVPIGASHALRRRSPIVAQYKRLGVNLKDLQA